MKTRALFLALAFAAAACVVLFVWTRVDVVRGVGLVRHSDAAQRAAARSPLAAGSRVAGEPVLSSSPPAVETLAAPAAGASLREPHDSSTPGVSEISFTVVDAVTGDPIEGVRFSGNGARWTGTSDRGGNLRVVARDDWVLRGAVTAEGYCPVFWRSESERAEGDLGILPLLRQATIEGRVADRAGDPVPAAVVRTLLSGRELDGRSGSRTFDYAQLLPSRWIAGLPRGDLSVREPSGFTVSNKDGVFRLSVTPASTPYRLRVECDGFLTRTDAAEVLASEPGALERVDIALVRGATVTGRLLRNGLEWSGSVLCERPEARMPRTVRAVDGAYELANLAPGPLRVFVESALTGELVAEATLEVRAEEAYRQDLVWSENVATIAGHVLGPGDRPLPGIAVTARSSTSRSKSRKVSLSTRSALSGSFELEVPAGETFTVRAADRVVRAELDKVPAGARDLRLVLGAAGVLSVKLVDAHSGAPIEPKNRRFLSWTKEGDRPRRPSAVATTVGRVQVRVPVGRGTLEVDLPQLGYLPKTVHDVVVSAGGGAVEIELRRGVNIDFTLPRESLRDLREHQVVLLDRDQLDTVRTASRGEDGAASARLSDDRSLVDRRRVVFDRQGTARLGPLAPGFYDLRCFPDDVELRPSSILIGTVDQTVELTLLGP